MPNKLLAASVHLGNIEGVGPMGQPQLSIATLSMRLAGTISQIIGFLTILGGIWFLFQLIIAGYRWISAGGEKQAVQEAQKRIQNAILGLIIVIAAYTLTGVVGIFLGIDILGLEDLLQTIAP